MTEKWTMEQELLENNDLEHIEDTQEGLEKPAKKRGWKIFFTVLLTLMVTAGAAAAVVKWGIPAYQYKQAGESFANGEYETAQALYEGLGEYKDAKDRAVEAQKMIVYVQAQEYYNQEQFVYAYETYESLGDFLDSAVRAKDARHMNEVKTTYIQAGDMLKTGFVYDAYEKLKSIAVDNYKDTKVQIEAAKGMMYDTAQQYAENGELPTARWYLEYLEGEDYTPAIGMWEEIKEREKFELDYSFYDIKEITPITRISRNTTKEEFAAVFMNMYLNGKTYTSFPTSNLSVNEMKKSTNKRIWEGDDMASEYLPEYGTVYQDGYSQYWYYGDMVEKNEIFLNYNKKYTKEELAGHMETIKSFCEESVLELMDAGLLGNSMSNRQKAQVIFNYVCYYLSYDDTKEIHNAGVAIEKREGVCESYVAIYNRMCNLAGVPSYGQIGDTNGDEEGRHIWSVQLDEEGNVFYTDVTWGDKRACWGGANIDNFYKTFYEQDMEDGMKNGPSCGVLKWSIDTYFWQTEKWASHVEERSAEEIIAYGNSIAA